MKHRLIVSLAVLVIGSALAPAALAQDADDLKAAVLDYYDAVNSEDDRASTFFLPGSKQFPRTGSLLQPNPTEGRPAGLDFEVEVRHLEATVHGDSGVATYYTTGTTRYPDGTILQGIFRASIVAIRQENQWKWAHLHISPLQSAPGQ